MSNKDKNDAKPEGCKASAVGHLVMPLQPIRKDKQGVLRFKENAVVRYLLDKGCLDMNDLALQGFDDIDMEQFAQLIGYSLSGFGDLSYVSDEAFGAAEAMVDGVSELEARNEALREHLDTVCNSLKIAVSAVFKIHPDDLIT